MGAGKRSTHPERPLCLHPSYDLLGQCYSAGLRYQEPARNAIQIMNFNAHGTKVSRLFLFVLFIAAEILLSMISLGAKSPKSALCSASEYHEFDFWIGDWDALDFVTSTKDARVRVDSILDG